MPEKFSLYIFVGNAIFVIIVALIKGVTLSKHKFKCSMCNEYFYPKWYQVMFETHFEEYFRIRCPHCGKKKYHRVID